MKITVIVGAALLASLAACGGGTTATHHDAARHTVHVLYEDSTPCQFSLIRPGGTVRLMDEHGTLLGTGRLDGGQDGARGCEFRASIAGVPAAGQYQLRGDGRLGTVYRSGAAMEGHGWDWDVPLR